MPPPSDPPESDDELQFATPEPPRAAAQVAAAPAQVCVVCHKPIASTYFALRDKVLCPACCEQVKGSPPGSRGGRLAKASLLGLGAGLVGAIIWFAIRRTTGYEIGLVAILVGFMVGSAVRKGSGGRGGRGYQVMAVILTYCCIAANYMPDAIEALVQESSNYQSVSNTTPSDNGATAADAPVSTNIPSDSSVNRQRPKVGLARGIIAVIIVLVMGFIFAFALPFLAGVHNPIGLLIIGFALWQAWKLNRAGRWRLRARIRSDCPAPRIWAEPALDR